MRILHILLTCSFRVGILKTFATGEHVQNLQNKLFLSGKTAPMLQNVSVSNCLVNATFLFEEWKAKQVNLNVIQLAVHSPNKFDEGYESSH